MSPPLTSVGGDALDDEPLKLGSDMWPGELASQADSVDEPHAIPAVESRSDSRDPKPVLSGCSDAETTASVNRLVEARLQDLEERLRKHIDERDSRDPTRKPLTSLRPISSPYSDKDEPPLAELQADLKIVKEALQQAVSVVRAAECSLKGQLSDYSDALRVQLEAARKSSQQARDDLCARGSELDHVQARLQVLSGELESERAQAVSQSQAREALMEELAKANKAVSEACVERQSLQERLEEACAQLEARGADLAAVADGAREREDELEERLASLRDAERALRGQLEAVQGELAKNEQDLRAELATVQAELAAARQELQRRQKCCFRMRPTPQRRLAPGKK